MRESNANHFLPGALAAILSFMVLWFVFAVAFVLVLMLVGADVFNRWAEALCMSAASILSFCCVAFIGRSIVRRDDRTGARSFDADSC